MQPAGKTCGSVCAAIIEMLLKPLEMQSTFLHAQGELFSLLQQLWKLLWTSQRQSLNHVGQGDMGVEQREMLFEVGTVMTLTWTGKLVDGGWAGVSVCGRGVYWQESGDKMCTTIPRQRYAIFAMYCKTIGMIILFIKKKQFNCWKTSKHTLCPSQLWNPIQLSQPHVNRVSIVLIFCQLVYTVHNDTKSTAMGSKNGEHSWNYDWFKNNIGFKIILSRNKL